MVAIGALLVGVALHPNDCAAAVMLGLRFFFNQATEGAFAANASAISGRHSGAAFGLMNTGANLMGFVNALLLSSVAAVLGGCDLNGRRVAMLAALFILLARADQQMDQAD